MSAVELLLLFSSALFAWRVGSLYTGAVIDAAFCASVVSSRTALVLTAVSTLGLEEVRVLLSASYKYAPVSGTRIARRKG